MIALFLAAAALGSSAIDAERAFARDAQRIGQWKAFRRWADHDAVMFVPQATWARDFLRVRKDPPRAISWQPAESITSCDGQVAVNIGPWQSPDRKRTGRFTTVWMKKHDGWRWIYDGGEPLATPAAAPTGPRLRQASCVGRPSGAPIMPAPKMPSAPTSTPSDVGRGESGDRTLGWDWKVAKDGSRTFRVFQWTGRSYATVLNQVIAPE